MADYLPPMNPNPLADPEFLIWHWRENAKYQRTYGSLIISAEQFDQYADTVEKLLDARNKNG